MKSTFNVFYRRKREGKTDYRSRLRILKGRVPRLVVRRSLKNVLVQLIEYNDNGDRVIASSHTNELKKLGWKGAKRNLTGAYFAGLLLGVKAKKKKFNNAVLDVGLYSPVSGSLIYAALKGAVDAGLKVPHSENVVPDKRRIIGEHLRVKNNFEEIRNKILKE